MSNGNKKILEYIEANNSRLLVDELDNLKGSCAVKYVLGAVKHDASILFKVLEMIENAEFSLALVRKLREVGGIEAAFLADWKKDIRTNLNYIKVYAVAKEHAMVDRSALLDIESKLSQQFHYMVEINVWARQNKDLEEFVEGMHDRFM